MKKALLAVTLLMFWASFAFGQFSAVEVNDTDTIDLASLVPTWHITLLHKSQGVLPGDVVLVSPQFCETAPGPTPPGGNGTWCGGNYQGSPTNPFTPLYLVQQPLTFQTTIATETTVGNCTTITVTALLGSNNLSRNSIPSTTLHYPSTCGSTSATVTTNDGSGITVTIKCDNGSTIVFPPFISAANNTSGWSLNYSTGVLSDAFGNTTTLTASSLTDSLGAVTNLAPGGSNYLSYKDTTGTTQDITFTGGTSQAFDAPGQWSCGSNSPANATPPITKFTFPDSTSISLTWGTFGSGLNGLIQSVTLRTGGQISLIPGTFANSCTSALNNAPAYSSLQRVTPDGTWNFSASTVSGVTTTTVLDPGKNKTVYVLFGTPWLGPTFTNTIDRYQNTGTVASPAYTHISETQYCYNTHSCTTAPAYPITQLDTYQYTYNAGTQVQMSHDVKLYDSTYGLVTSDAATDSITSQTITTTYVYGTYSSGTCSAITNTKIVDHPCTVTTKNGSTWLSESTYTYNSNGALTSSAACLSSTCTGSSALTTTYTPTTQGTYSAIQDPNGQTVNYTYGSCNSLMPTDVTTTVNSVAIDHKTTWNCDAGVVTDTTDPNSNEDDYTYDSMNRLHTYHDYMGDTNTTTYDYGTPTLDHVKVTDNIGVVSYQYNDGLGRPTVSQVYQGTGTNYDTMNFTRGWNGTNFQVNTYGACSQTLGNGCSQASATIANYINPIAGPTERDDINSGTLKYAVNSKDFSVTAGPAPGVENTKVIQTEIDGFGRVTSTCALESSGGTTCGQTMGNSGILTSNVYSFATGAPKVVTTRGSQSHTTIADAVGRTTSVQTPEGGTITYTYDSATTTGCSTQTSAGALLEVSYSGSSIYNCYVVDGLQRLTDVGNTNSTNNATNPCKRFRYDSTANNAYTKPTGYPSSGANLVGRLMEASTDNCTFPLAQADMITDEWFAYDAMGRMTDMWEWSPNSGSAFRHTTATYDADGNPLTLGGIPSVSTITYTVDGEGRWKTATYGASTTIVSGVTYDAASRPTEIDLGTGTDKDKYTYDTLGNMTQYQFFVGSNNNKGVLTWNSIGSLGQLAITDGLNTNNTQTCKFGTSTTKGYDDVGRILDDDCGTVWAQTYSYDQYDNITKSGSSSWGCSTCYSSTNNQQTSTPALTYDSDGNVKSDGTNTYTWNYYEKMASENSTNFTYDAFDRMVAYGTYEYLYSPLGKLGNINKSPLAVESVPLPGGSVVAIDTTSGLHYFHRDWLGSVRTEANVNGTLDWSKSYSPYGDVYNSSSTDSHFAGIDGDTWTGITYSAPNRELQQNASRWVSPDPAHSGWNAYAYVTDPNTQTDPSGLCDQVDPTNCPSSQDVPLEPPSCVSSGFSEGILGACVYISSGGTSGVGFSNGNGFTGSDSTSVGAGGIAIGLNTGAYNTFGIGAAATAFPVISLQYRAPLANVGRAIAQLNRNQVMLSYPLEDKLWIANRAVKLQMMGMEEPTAMGFALHDYMAANPSLGGSLANQAGEMAISENLATSLEAASVAAARTGGSTSGVVSLDLLVGGPIQIMSKIATPAGMIVSLEKQTAMDATNDVPHVTLSGAIGEIVTIILNQVLCGGGTQCRMF